MRPGFDSQQLHMTSKSEKYRKSWLRKRGEGSKRPLPLPILEVNAKGVTAPPEVSMKIIHRASQAGYDMLFVCEAANMSRRQLEAVLPRDEWDISRDEADLATRGSFIALRKKRGYLKQKRTLLGVRPYIRGRRIGMRPRHIRKTKAVIDPGTPHRWTFQAAAAHLPPKRFWAIWGVMAARVSGTVIGADWNKLAGAVRVATRRKTRMHHIMGFAIRFWIPASPTRTEAVGSDHLAVGTTLWPRR